MNNHEAYKEREVEFEAAVEATQESMDRISATLTLAVNVIMNVQQAQTLEVAKAHAEYCLSVMKQEPPAAQVLKVLSDNGFLGDSWAN